MLQNETYAGKDTSLCRQRISYTSTLTARYAPPLEPWQKQRFLILLSTAICRLAEPIAITSILPYAWRMTKDFGLHNASFYAGILVASFSLSEAAFSMFWGHLSDRVGRKPVLLFGCFGTIVSLLIVGFSTTFTMALCGRVVGGALNGNIGMRMTDRLSMVITADVQ